MNRSLLLSLRTTILILILAAPVVVTRAQEPERLTGVITGSVVNLATREPIVGANIVVLGTQYGSSTDINGAFRIAGVPVGSYQVRASVIGYLQVIKTDVLVATAKPTDLDFMLEESKVEIGEVEITAEYFQKTPDIPLSTQRQSNEDIRRLPGGFEDVVRAVSILPGVAQAENGRNDLIVRGGAPSENLYLIDNIDVPNINHFGTQGATGGPLSYINLDFVEGTTFSSGGFGVRYGDRLSSVLGIDLRHGREDRLGGKATISASQFGLNLEGPISEGGTFLFSARRSYLDFIFKAAGFGFVPEYWDFLGKVNYRLGPKDEISVLAIAALDNVRLFNDTEDQRFDNSDILASDQNQVVAGIRWQHLFTSGYAVVSAGNTYNDYDTRQSDSLLNPIFRNISYERSSTLRGDVVLQFSRRTEVAAGVQGQIVAFSADMFLRPFMSSFGESLRVDRMYDTTSIKAGFYGQVTQTVGPVRITAGLRGEYFSLIDKPFVLAPRISATVPLSLLTNLNVSAGRYSQAPSTIWLVARPENRDLQHIAADQFVLGFDHLLREDTKISIEGYMKRYYRYPASTTRPYLVLANTGAGYGGSNEGFASFGLDLLESAGTGRAMGAELFLQKKLSRIPCYGIFSISYTESRFTAKDGVERPGSFDQRWIVNLGGGYVFDERWEVSTKFRLASGRPYTPFNDDGTQSASRYNAVRVATNHSLDVRVDRRWAFERFTLIAFVDIQNIYNNPAEGVPRYNARLGRAESESAIGILPSIGLSLEF